MAGVAKPHMRRKVLTSGNARAETPPQIPAPTRILPRSPARPLLAALCIADMTIRSKPLLTVGWTESLRE